MDDLLKKLNVLVKSTLHEAVNDHPAQKLLASLKPSGDMGRDVEQLRGRINDALSFEDGLQKRVQSLEAEVEDWDRQADEAVAAGQDANARYALEQMQRARQRLTIAQADLREHQLVTQELISHVNELDAAVADAKQAQRTPPAQKGQNVAVSDDQPLIENLPIRDEESRSDAPTLNASEPPDNQTAEDDLARRRQRLSKPE